MPLDDILFSYWLISEIDVTEKPVDPIKVYSEKELIKEIEKIASTLVPEKDWSLRIAAMQRVEGLVFGGFTSSEHFCFLNSSIRILFIILLMCFFLCIGIVISIS